MNRHISREFRNRVNRLHRYWDKYSTITGFQDIRNPIAPFRATQTNTPFDCMTHVQTMAEVIGWGEKYPQHLANATMFAAAVKSQDASLKVRARFGVERAEDECLYGLPFCDIPPTLFYNGWPYSEGHVDQDFDRLCMHNTDLRSVQRIRLDLKSLADSRVVTAKWQPKFPNKIYSADCMRPPVETLHLVKEFVEANKHCGVRRMPFGADEAPNVLMIGCGFSATGQLLSGILPTHKIYSIPIPYDGWIPSTKTEFEVLVINIPTRQHWLVAEILVQERDSTFLERRSIFDNQLPKSEIENFQHVAQILSLVKLYRRPGQLIVLMGDPEPYLIAKQIMENELETAGQEFVDTANREIWVDYPSPPWAPFHLPAATGKLVSFWRVL